MIKIISQSFFLYFLNLSISFAESDNLNQLTEDQSLALFAVIVVVIVGGLILEHSSWGKNIFKWLFIIPSGLAAIIGLTWYTIEEKSIFYGLFTALIIYGFIELIKELLRKSKIKVTEKNGTHNK